MEVGPGDSEGARRRAADALAAGVTLVLDKGWGDETVIELLRSMPPEERPHVEAAAQIISVPDGYFPGFGHVIEPEAIADSVARQAKAGRGWVKLAGDWPRRGRGPVSNFTEAELATAVQVAGQHGSKVAIHTMAPGTPSDAVRAGVQSIEHGLFLTEDDVVALGEREGSWVPTVGRMEAVIRQLGADSSGGRLIREGLDNVERLLLAAIESGVRVLTGTDLEGSTAQVVDEGIRLKQLGLSNGQVLSAVSDAGFDSVGRTSVFEVGASADAVLFAANPLEDLEVLRHPVHVIRKGAVR